MTMKNIGFLFLSGALVICVTTPTATAQTTLSTPAQPYACKVGSVIGFGGFCDIGSERFRVWGDNWSITLISSDDACSDGQDMLTLQSVGVSPPVGVPWGTCRRVTILQPGRTASGWPALRVQFEGLIDSFIACMTSSTDWVIEVLLPHQERAWVCQGGNVARWAAEWGRSGLEPVTTDAGTCKVGLVLGPGGSCDVGSAYFAVTSTGAPVAGGRGIVHRRVQGTDYFRIVGIP